MICHRFGHDAHKDGYPLRRGFSVLALTALQYWIIRFRG